MSDHLSKFRLGGPNGPEYTVTLKDGLDPHQAAPGLYRVVCRERDRQIVVERTTAVNTRHAAVNGIQNDLDRAAFVMLDKVNASSALRREAAPVEFTLYHVPTRGVAQDVALTTAELAGQSTSDARQLAGVLEQTARSGQPVVWSVHSRGALVFDLAARNCAQRGVRLPNESVAVYNGAVNEQVLNHDAARTGLTKLGRGYFNNPGDPVPQLVGDNTINPLRRAAALYNTYGVITSDQSLHTWHAPLTEQDFASVPPGQWEEPGVDRRPPPGQTVRAESSQELKAKSAASHRLDHLREARLDGPTRTLVTDAIAARDTYASGSAAERAALLASCRTRFRGELGGPDRTGVPLRTAALGFVEGTVAADTLLSLARKHSAATQLEQGLARVPVMPELGLGR
jgi:hypothetical protein